MKNIFKKNQIIITALAIMIVIAGYLSFTNKDKTKDVKKDVQTIQQDVGNQDKLSEKEVGILDTASNTTGTTDTTNTNVTTTIAPTNMNGKTNDTNTNKDELGDISDDDILKAAKNVTDTGEIENKEKNVPGEAVLASATLEAGFFSSKRLEREQLRANNREALMEIVESTKLSESAKKEATQKVVELTEIASQENATELLLEAKGFADAIVCINKGEAEVVINSASLTDQQLAIIENIVKTKTNIDVKHIHINAAVVNE